MFLSRQSQLTEGIEFRPLANIGNSSLSFSAGNIYKVVRVVVSGEDVVYDILRPDGVVISAKGSDIKRTSLFGCAELVGYPETGFTAKEILEAGEYVGIDSEGLQKLIKLMERLK